MDRSKVHIHDVLADRFARLGGAAAWEVLPLERYDPEDHFVARAAAAGVALHPLSACTRARAGHPDVRLVLGYAHPPPPGAFPYPRTRAVHRRYSGARHAADSQLSFPRGSLPEDAHRVTAGPEGENEQGNQ